MTALANFKPSILLQTAMLTTSRTVVNTGWRMIYPLLSVFARSVNVELATLASVIPVIQLFGLTAPIWGSVSERQARKFTILLGLGMIIVGSAIVYLLPTLYGLALALIMIGVGKIAFDPAIQAYVGDRVPYERRGMYLGIIELAWSGAFLIGVPAMTWLIGRYNWQAPFAAIGVLSVVSIGLAWWMLEADKPTQRQRLLIFNLRTDMDDHILGFTTRWINELAQHYTHIDVLTTHAGHIAVADNVTVYSTGRERDNSRLARIANFYGHLSRLLLKHKYDACFAHMQPLFAAMGAPLLMLRGVKTTTWYTHRQRNKQVEWATRLSYRVVTAVESSYPVPTPKLRALGHGIDTDFYTPSSQLSESKRIVQVARLTDIKHQHILLHAAKDLDCEIVLVGDIPDGFDDSYKQHLHALVDELGIRDKVIFAGAQTPAQVREWYQGAAIAVNLSPVGLFDKAALEGMACAIPTITSNPAFASLNGDYDAQLRISAPDATHNLSATLQSLLTLPIQTRRTIGQHQREGIIAHHSLQNLVQKLIAVMHTGELPT